MGSSNKGTAYEGLRSQAALKEYLEFLDENRAELARERKNAVRSGHLDLAIQCSKDLRLLHRDYLQGALKAVLIRHSQTRRRAQHPRSEWPQYEFWKRILGRQAADAKLKEWKDANAKEETPDSTDPLSLENFTIEFALNEFSVRMEGERTFLENLKQLAQQDGNSSLVRACWNELRLLEKDLFDRQIEIDKFERDHAPPDDPHAKTAEILEARERFIEAIKKVAEESGISLAKPE